MNKSKIKGKWIIKILEIVFIIIIIISAWKIIEWLKENKENKQIVENIKMDIKEEKVNIKETKGIVRYRVDFKSLKEKNNDAIGWIKVKGTNVDYPVVQTENNSFYMNHNFDKKYNKAGWIFADYRNSLDGTDKNVILYGHNRRNEEMFGSLKHVLNPEWYQKEENKYITFITETENYTYEVFSAYQIENEDYYLETDFENGEFKKFIDIIKQRSVHNFNVKVTEMDRILTLSTCANNSAYRIVVHAKRLN